MPTLNWIGKEAVVRHHKDVPFRLLEPVPELSCGPNDGRDSGNLIVQGDNLHALKALLPRYAGQVKCIYIDPPYNTGNEGWVYNDNVNSPEIRRWLGEVVGKEGETLDRHDRWLCMMYPRLMLLRNFLTFDGVIFVSIDDNELHHLRCLAEQIPTLNFSGCITWERKRKGSRLSKKITKKTEYIAIFSAKKDELELVGEDVGKDEDFPLIKRTNAISELRIPFAKIGVTKLRDGVYAAGTYGKGGTTVELLNPVSVSNGHFLQDVHLRSRFIWTQKNLNDELAAGGQCFIRTMNFSLRAVKGAESQGQKGLSTLFLKEIGTNEDASEELSAIFSAEVNSMFQYSKPVNLIQTLVRAATYHDKNAIVMDSFAGSGTTAHAVLQCNANDGGNRKFILVELEEKIAIKVTSERIRRVISGYRDSDGEIIAGFGGSFQFCRLSSEALFNAFGQISPTVTFSKLAEFVWFAETGTGYTGPADSPLLGIHEGRAIYLLYNGILKDQTPTGGNVLTAAVLDSLPHYAGPRTIYAAASRLGTRAAREGITFKQTPYALDV